MEILKNTLYLVICSIVYLFVHAYLLAEFSGFFLEVLPLEGKAGFELYGLLSIGHLLATILAAILVSILISYHFKQKFFLVGLIVGLSSILLISTFEVESGWPLAVMIKDTLLVVFTPAIVSHFLAKISYFKKLPDAS
ncbi:hypothetical protein [Thalassotalea sp. G2M2-11]|uniref:hypothetical protein n=1 Tax=Thalassotalea sp. G2M2-11 TaxID=2787627 RepID=UPI0019CFC428|nr:hypothetical protein [Thalassotalea sp. G2M2-11]